MSEKIETVQDLISYLKNNCLVDAPIRVQVQVGSHTTLDNISIQRPTETVKAYVVIGDYYGSTDEY